MVLSCDGNGCREWSAWWNVPLLTLICTEEDIHHRLPPHCDGSGAATFEWPRAATHRCPAGTAPPWPNAGHPGSTGHSGGELQDSKQKHRAEIILYRQFILGEAIFSVCHGISQVLDYALSVVIEFSLLFFMSHVWSIAHICFTSFHNFISVFFSAFKMHMVATFSFLLYTCTVTWHDPRS